MERENDVKIYRQMQNGDYSHLKNQHHATPGQILAH